MEGTPKLRVLYVSNIDKTSSVFNSQVRGVFAAWRSCGANIKLAFRTRVERLRDSSLDDEIPLYSLPSFGSPTWALEQKRWKTAFDLNQFDVIHCRGVEAAWSILNMRSRLGQNSRTKVIYDCRGSAVEELAVNSVSGWRRPFLSLRQAAYRSGEKFVVENCDILTAVSPSLSMYLNQHYGRPADLVFPCVVTPDFSFNEAARERIRADLSITSELVYIFVGAPAPWQRLDTLGEWWRKRRTIDDGAKLIILTQDQSKFQHMSGLNPQLFKDVIYKTAAHKDVASWMSAADVGVLFRDDSVVNAVSSPVKMSEYLATGLKVLTNQSYFLNLDPQNIILESGQVVDEAPLTSVNDRRARSASALGQLTAEKYVEKLMALLR